MGWCGGGGGGGKRRTTEAPLLCFFPQPSFPSFHFGIMAHPLCIADTHPPHTHPHPLDREACKPCPPPPCGRRGSCRSSSGSLPRQAWNKSNVPPRPTSSTAADDGGHGGQGHDEHDGVEGVPLWVWGWSGLGRWAGRCWGGWVGGWVEEEEEDGGHEGQEQAECHSRPCRWLCGCSYRELQPPPAPTPLSPLPPPPPPP